MTTTTTTDPYPDSKLEELIAKNEVLAETEDTWLDADFDVAWNAEPGESRAADLRELLLEAGWEKCYHRESARLHFNVKVDGSGIYRGIEDTITSANLHPDARERIREIVQTLHDDDVRMFWEFDLDEFLFGLARDGGLALRRDSLSVWSCGRSGGYLNVPKLETDGDSMIRLAQFLARSRDAFNSYEQGKYLATEAIERDRERELEKLASPRIERIEA